jgi:hypothetical protein
MLARMATSEILVVAKPIEACCYCWYTMHGDEPYPDVSSTICEPHTAWVIQRLAEQRAARRIAEGGCTSRKPLINWEMLATHPQALKKTGGKA